MAEEEEDSPEEPEGPKGAWLKQFVILAVLVLAGQSIVAYFLVTEQIVPGYFGQDDGSEEAIEAKAMKREAVVVEAPILYSVDEMIVNPQDYHILRYLNVKMTLELDAQETLDLVKSDPVIPAKLLEVIRMTMNMTSFFEMDEARERGPLRQKVVSELNASGLLNDGSVDQVYFERFVAQ
jgi:flagellar basal body-associated protein FliL